MQDTVRDELAAMYGIPLDSELLRDKRGMMNDTWFVASDAVLTVFKSRSAQQVDQIARIVSCDASGLFPKILPSVNGLVGTVEGKPVILWKRVLGRHYVGQDHAQKDAIPEQGHKSIAGAFWRLHASIGRCAGAGCDVLGRVNYLPATDGSEPPIDFNTLPTFLKTETVRAYLGKSALPLEYPVLVHHDMERQNFIHAEDGKVLAVVDADSLKSGDLLFEYGRCMMNFMFTDPAYKPHYPHHYMAALRHAGMVDVQAVAIIPPLLDAFVAKDLLDYCRYESSPPKTDLQSLAGLYGTARKRAKAYFDDFSWQQVLAFEAQTHSHLRPNNRLNFER